MQRILTFVLFFAILASCSPSKDSNKMDGASKPKNVILLIGDGMGLATTYAAMIVSEQPLNIERCPVTGLQKTYSSNRFITDSGASGTALATGNKTKNGMIGTDSLGNEVKTILEYAEENGLATGLVSTSTITHATPASFISHDTDRSNYESIAMDFLGTDIEVFIGGGYDHFAKRSDGLNLADSLKARGYEVCTTMDMVMKSGSAKIAGLVAPESTPYRLDGRGDMLPDASQKAIEILNRDNEGFFLMIEGSQIDWAAGKADTLIDETLDFDKAVGMALDFAEKDGNTLVVITGDHETGGVTVVGGDRRAHTVEIDFSTDDHTALMVPVYAYGPGSERFTGIYENTGVFDRILESYGF